MNKQIERQKDGSVPVEAHYEIFKNIEKTIQDSLRRNAHEELLIGLRVAYDDKDSSSEPGVFPYSIESGYLGFVDLLFQCPVQEKDREKEVGEEDWNFPISAELMDELYDTARDSLEAAAGEGVELRVGVFYTFTGSPTKAGGVRCGCGNSTTKRDSKTGNSLVGVTSAKCDSKCK
ncbi:MAG: hypothetical protein U0V02_09135 [Anaerolineales bacterium]